MGGILGTTERVLSQFGVTFLLTYGPTASPPTIASEVAAAKRQNEPQEDGGGTFLSFASSIRDVLRSFQ